MNGRRFPRRWALAVVALIAMGCGGSDSGAGPTAPKSDDAQSARVQATEQLTFAPREAEVPAGGTVTWQFGSVAHNVTFQIGSDDAATYYGGQTSDPNAPPDIPTTSDASVARTF